MFNSFPQGSGARKSERTEERRGRDRARSIGSELPGKERLALLSRHSLRAGLAPFAEVDEHHVQKHLGHASAGISRRDRFRVSLAKAAGL